MAEVRRDRADAARNRRAILRATEELLARHRPDEISMEQVAAAAGRRQRHGVPPLRQPAWASCWR